MTEEMNDDVAGPKPKKEGFFKRNGLWMKKKTVGVYKLLLRRLNAIRKEAREIADEVELNFKSVVDDEGNPNLIKGVGTAFGTVVKTPWYMLRLFRAALPLSARQVRPLLLFLRQFL